MWNNKIKAVILIGLLYIFRKCWILYTTYIKPFLDMSKMMSGSKEGGDKGKQGGQVEEDDQSDDEYYDELANT